MVKKLLILSIGICLGCVLYQQTDIYALNCDTTKYGYQFELGKDLSDPGMLCLDDNINIVKINDIGFKIKYIKMELEYFIYKVKHRND